MESATVLPRYNANCHCGAVKVSFYLDEPLENKEIVICNCRPSIGYQLRSRQL